MPCSAGHELARGDGRITPVQTDAGVLNASMIVLYLAEVRHLRYVMS
jgi:hypothetical protein